MRGVRRLVVAGGSVVLLAACAAAPPPSPTAAPVPPPAPAAAPVPAPPPPPPVAVAPVPPPPPPPEPLPEVFESDEFVVVVAKEGDTAAGLAQRFLGDAGQAWMIADYNDAATFRPGQVVVVPRRPWNLAGVDPTGYQIVPILCYHNIGPQARGRLLMSVAAFEEQMRYLKREGFHVIGLRELHEFLSLRRQLPRKTVVLTFDDGWKSFQQYSAPLLRELGFGATLFIYTDFVGARVALTWEEIKELGRQGFDIQAHSKTHGDMRRKPGEGEAEYARRLDAELVQPLALFRRHLGEAPRFLAYPYGSHDEEVERLTREAGYLAAFDVRRQGNPSFAHPLVIHRAQIYSEMSLEDFTRNLAVFSEEPIR